MQKKKRNKETIRKKSLLLLLFPLFLLSHRRTLCKGLCAYDNLLLSFLPPLFRLFGWVLVQGRTLGAMLRIAAYRILGRYVAHMVHKPLLVFIGNAGVSAFKLAVAFSTKSALHTWQRVENVAVHGRPLAVQQTLCVPHEMPHQGNGVGLAQTIVQKTVPEEEEKK